MQCSIGKGMLEYLISKEINTVSLVNILKPIVPS
ncbi:MAG: hypothetical protein ACI9HU_001657 [Colwellia sp.]|jgi:hypothetical protein